MNEKDQAVDIVVNLVPKVEEFFDLQWNNFNEIFIQRIKEVISGKPGKIIQINYELKEFKRSILKELKESIEYSFLVKTYKQLENCVTTRLNLENTINVVFDEIQLEYTSYQENISNLKRFEVLRHSLRHYNVNILWLVPLIQERKFVDNFFKIKYYLDKKKYG